MAKINAILYKSKLLSNGEHPVMIRIALDYKRKLIATGYSSSVAQWDSSQKLPKRSHPYFEDLTTVIRAKLAEASKLNVLSVIEDKESSADELAHSLKRGNQSRVTLLEFFESFTEELYEEKRIGYSKVFRYVKNSISSFTNGRDYRFKEIDSKFLQNYVQFLKDKKTQTTTRSVYFRTFRTLFKEAIKRKICPSSHYPFKDFDFSDYNDPDTEARAIDKSEVRKLFEIAFEPETRRFLSQMMFKFSYYASGMNFIDMALLQWKNVKKDTIEYVREKTGKLIVVSLTPPVREVLDYYKNLVPVNAESFVFPIINKEYPATPKAENAKRNNIAQKRGRFNKDLKLMAKIAGIDENLSSYTARHSFAHNSYRYGVEKKFIGQALGHRYEKVTNKYIGKLDHKTVAEEIFRAID